MGWNEFALIVDIGMMRKYMSLQRRRAGLWVSEMKDEIDKLYVQLRSTRVRNMQLGQHLSERCAPGAG